MSILPDDYASTYVEVRDCRRSGDHDFNYMRVLADPDAVEAYLGQMVAFPVGSIVVKEEYDPADENCTEAVTEWTVMMKLVAGSATEQLDWHWQRIRVNGTVTDNERGCASCHRGCGVPPEGYDGTCTLP
jgi:hypothetical protein